MDCDDPNRRKVLSSVAATGLAGVYSQTAGAKQKSEKQQVTIEYDDIDCTTDPDELEADDKWCYEQSFEWEGHDGYLAEFAGSLATSVGYFGSTYISGREAIYHDFRFVTAIGSELLNSDEADPLTTEWLNDQWFDIRSTSLEWAETTKDEHFGVWPVGDEGGDTIDLGSPAFEGAALAISAINPTVGFALGATSLAGSMLNTGSQTEDGLSMEHRHENCGWFTCGADEVEEMGHHKRIFAVQDYTSNTCPIWGSCKDQFTIETGVKVRPEFQRPSPSLEMAFEVDGHDQDMEPFSETDTDLEELSDRQLKDLGIKRVETGSNGEVAAQKLDSLSNSEIDMLSRFAAEDDTVYFMDFSINSELISKE